MPEEVYCYNTLGEVSCYGEPRPYGQSQVHLGQKPNRMGLVRQLICQFAENQCCTFTPQVTDKHQTGNWCNSHFKNRLAPSLVCQDSDDGEVAFKRLLHPAWRLAAFMGSVRRSYSFRDAHTCHAVFSRFSTVAEFDTRCLVLRSSYTLCSRLEHSYSAIHIFTNRLQNPMASRGMV